MKTTLQAVEIDGLTLPAPARASVRIPVDGATLPGELCIPANAGGVVLFAHGSGSSRHSPRNRFVADVIQASGTGTLLFDLLTHAEESEDAADGHLRFDIDLLARRLIIPNPAGGMLDVTAPLPPHMKKTFDLLGFD